MYYSRYESCVLPDKNERRIHYVGNQYSFLELTSTENDSDLIYNGFMQYWEDQNTGRFVRWMDKYDEQIIAKCKAYYKEVHDLTTDYDSLPF